MKKMQHQVHTAVQEGNYNLFLHGLQQFLPLYFSRLNLNNYLGYGAYYVKTLSLMDTFPGLKDTVSLKGYLYKPKTNTLFE